MKPHLFDYLIITVMLILHAGLQIVLLLT